MNIVYLFGEGKDLNILQMCDRSFVVFIIALILIRISGRRSFGIRTPLDNIIVILLGATLSRGIVGASPFIPVIIASFLFVILHRALGWLIVYNKMAARIIEGEQILLFEDGTFLQESVRKALVCKEDIMQGVRKSALTDDLDKIDRIYMERNGEISALKKHGY
ncbi:MAG: DUF421 domain-containing protein [Flavipsychrobacter sp.]|nr:DUF421 domain-containing protein [Flavipsychrobacter sp.]